MANRYSSQILIEITNPQDPDETSLDTTRRDNAINDADAYFQIFGISLDTDNISHVAVIVEGAFTRLQVVAGNFPVSAWENWKDTVRELALVGPNKRIKPTTNSPLQPSIEETGAKPFSDMTRSRRYKGRGPAGTGPTFE